jgi:3-hydroxybutyryl-CoA dehydrogenase
MSDKVAHGHIGMKAKHGFYDWTDESIEKEKARFERALLGAMEILENERDS